MPYCPDYNAVVNCQVEIRAAGRNSNGLAIPHDKPIEIGRLRLECSHQRANPYGGRISGVRSLLAGESIRRWSGRSSRRLPKSDWSRRRHLPTRVTSCALMVYAYVLDGARCSDPSGFTW